MANLITIDQLLESVDLNFEPRWVTKDKGGLICVYTEKPECGICSWFDGGNYMHIGYLKLSEFDGKDWTECIYEVPRKTTGKIEKIKYITSFDILENSIGDQTVSAIGGRELANKINELIDAVNELKGAKNE